MAKTYQNGVLKFKDKDGNAGELWGFSKKEREDTLAAIPQVQKNKEDIAKFKQAFPNIDQVAGNPVDLNDVALKSKENTFAGDNTFSKNITMSVVQDNIELIEDQHLVTGKALKALKKTVSGKEVIKFVDQSPDVGTMDPDVLYFFPAPVAGP